MSDEEPKLDPQVAKFYAGVWSDMLLMIRQLLPLASPPLAFRWWTDLAKVPRMSAGAPFWTAEECARLEATAAEFREYLVAVKKGEIPPPPWVERFKGIVGIDPEVSPPAPLSDEIVGNLASRLLYSDDSLRVSLEKAHLPTDDEERAIRRDNFIQIIRSWLSEHH